MYRCPDRFKWARFDAPHLPMRTRADARELAARAVDCRTVVLYGKTQSGKTTLATAIGREAARRFDRNAMYVTATELDVSRKQAPLGHGDAELVQRAIDVPILVIDELGAEARESQAIVDVLHARRDTKDRQTIVTLSILPPDAFRRYADGVATRLFGGGLTICTDGPTPAPPAKPERLDRRPLANLPGPRSPLPPGGGYSASAPSEATSGPPAAGEPVPCPPELRARLFADLERVGCGPSAGPSAEPPPDERARAFGLRTGT